MHLAIVTAERSLLDEDGVEFVSVPGSKGRLGILPEHTPLLSTLEAGDLYFRRGGEEVHFAVSGGFVEVAEDRVIILADTAERAEEIEEARAEEARRRAEELLRRREQLSREELLRAETSLRKAILRLKVSRWRKQSPGAGRQPRGPAE